MASRKRACSTAWTSWVIVNRSPIASPLTKRSTRSPLFADNRELGELMSKKELVDSGFLLNLSVLGGDHGPDLRHHIARWNSTRRHLALVRRQNPHRAETRRIGRGLHRRRLARLKSKGRRIL